MDAGTTLTDAWPLFGLRLRTANLVLRMPTDDDLAGLLGSRKAGIHPPDEMPFGWRGRRSGARVRPRVRAALLATRATFSPTTGRST
jgi:hypothetical protein